MSTPGPLSDIRIVELAGKGPAPFGMMMLADMGADIIRIDRPPNQGTPGYQGQTMGRGRRSVAVDLKHRDAADFIGRVSEKADVLVEPFRPGVAERLGIGPDDLLRRNPRLVYARMTGWGQEGPLAQQAGHDINYIAVAGVLDAIGRKGQPPTPPLNLAGDFGGGGMLLALGVLAALWERQRSGHGQVIDAAMVDGASLMMTMFHELRANQRWSEHRGTNYLDTGAPFYEVYKCSDHRYLAVGAVDTASYERLLAALRASSVNAACQRDSATWADTKATLTEIFESKGRDEWCELLASRDVCVTPVLRMSEMADHPHHQARATLVDVDGVRQPAPAPRFSRTPSTIRRGSPPPGLDTDAALRDWLGWDGETTASRRAAGLLF